MANNCWYDMHVCGTRESLDEFWHVLQDYDYPRHFYRVFSAEKYDSYQNKDGTFTDCISGDCAWSVRSCMTIAPVGTYAKGDRETDTSLQLESQRLGLKIEVFSAETGVGFQEHYRYENGVEIANEETDYGEFEFEPSEYEGDSVSEKFESFLKENGLSGCGYSLADLDDCNWLSVGGFGNDYCNFDF